MESKWYFFPGQTAENTKISERAHALHITNKAWGKINKHLDRKRLIQEAIEKEKAHKKALKEGSEAMTKQWKNSIENIRTRQERERHEHLHQKKEDKIQLFYKMKAEQEKIREELVEKIREEMYRSSGDPKELTSALILSETLYERERQKEFNEMLKQHEKEVKEEDAKRVKEQAEKLLREDEEKRRVKREKDLEFGRLLREQIVREKKISEEKKRSHIEREIQDSINAAKEIELMKQYERDQIMKKRHDIKMEKKKQIEEEHLRQKLAAKEKEEMEAATEFYRQAKERIDCLMKNKVKEMRENAIAMRQIMADKIAIVRQNEEAEENQRLARAIAERDEDEKAKREAKLALQAQFRQDRIEDHTKYLERIEKEKRDEIEIKKWEMLNRYKTAEVIQEYNEKNRREKLEKILAYKRELDEQCKEEAAIKQEEKEIEAMLYKIALAEDKEIDKMFFKYADEVLKLAKSKNRSTYPIEKVIVEYKKANNLLDKYPQRKCQKYHK